MPIKARKIRTATEFIKDENNFTTGQIVEILDCENGDLELQILTQAIPNSITVRLWINQVLNNRKFEVKGEKKLSYNRVTTLLLALNIITEKELLKSLKSSADKVGDLNELLLNKTVKFQLELQKDKKSFERPILSSFKFIETLKESEV